LFKCNSSTLSFYDDLKNIQKEITSCENYDIPENIMQGYLAQYKDLIQNFTMKLESLEINVVIAALCNSNGQLNVDIFKKYNKETCKMEKGSEKDLCGIFCVRYYLGYFYKLAYNVLLKGEELELHNLHNDLKTDKGKEPSIHLFAELASDHLKNVCTCISVYSTFNNPFILRYSFLLIMCEVKRTTLYYRKF
jgi:hypothetical protein